MAYTLIPTELILDNAVTSAKLDTNIAVSGTLASTGVLTANAGVVVDNFTLDGTTLALSSGNFTIDVAGNIVVDTDTGYIQLADAGTVFGSFKQGSSNLEIKAEVQDKDVLIKGNDGGTEITALTFDMSAAGVATFNSTIVSPLIDAAVVDGENFKINGGQGTDGQVLTSTGSGVAWEASSGTTINNNADNRIITGSGTANTLEGEANLVFTGSNLGISVASPTVPLDIQSNSSASAIRIRGRSDDIAEVDFYNNANNSVMARFQVDTGYFATHVNGSERMRILDGGQLRIGTTSIITGSGEMISVVAPSQGMAIKTDNYCTMLWATGGGSTPTYCFFLSGSSSSTHQGSITKNGGGISYGSNSDYRLKENLDYTWDATTRLKQLKPVRFNWIADETNTLIDGFIAHEVQSVVPEAVTGIKDATHTAEEANESIIVDEGDIKAQQMDASKLIPLLVKAMQEQQALIEAQATTITDLTARIETLEG